MAFPSVFASLYCIASFRGTHDWIGSPGKKPSKAARLSTLEQDGWELASGVASNEEHPDTFWIPTAKARASIGPTDFVKLSFQVIQSDDVAGQVVVGERMWVKEGTHGPYFWGTLANDPSFDGSSVGVMFGVEVMF